MAGMIEQQMGKPVAQPQEPPAPKQEKAPQEPPRGANPEGAQKYKTKVVDVLPEELREPFERVVLAGMKILYSPKMKGTIEQELAKNAPVERKLAEGTAGLMALIDSQAKKGLPREIIIPAGIELLHEAADFLQSTGRIQASPEQLQQASMYLAVILAKRYGASDQDIQGMFAGQAKPPAAGAEPPAPAPQEEEV